FYSPRFTFIFSASQRQNLKKPSSNPVSPPNSTIFIALRGLTLRIRQPPAQRKAETHKKLFEKARNIHHPVRNTDDVNNIVADHVENEVRSFREAIISFLNVDAMFANTRMLDQPCAALVQR